MILRDMKTSVAQWATLKVICCGTAPQLSLVPLSHYQLHGIFGDYPFFIGWDNHG
jgi:hypothetical protein